MRAVEQLVSGRREGSVERRGGGMRGWVLDVETLLVAIALELIPGWLEVDADGPNVTSQLHI